MRGSPNAAVPRAVPQVVPRAMGTLAATAAVFLAGCGASRPPPDAGPDSRGDAAPTGTPSEPLVGGCGPAPGLQPKYLLPFPPGEAYTLTQGNCGAASHGGRFRYAFDFRMPPGTPVLAARDGVVTLARDDRPDGTGRVGDENIVIIEHDDGELSRYIHLQRHSGRVRRGEAVAAGDTIALSGNSGRSAFPHLHFDVADRCGAGGCRTTPAAFLNSRSPIPEGRRRVEARSFEGRWPPPDSASAAP